MYNNILLDTWGNLNGLRDVGLGVRTGYGYGVDKIAAIIIMR